MKLDIEYMRQKVAKGTLIFDTIETERGLRFQTLLEFPAGLGCHIFYGGPDRSLAERIFMEQKEQLCT